MKRRNLVVAQACCGTQQESVAGPREGNESRTDLVSRPEAPASCVASSPPAAAALPAAPLACAGGGAPAAPPRGLALSRAGGADASAHAPHHNARSAREHGRKLFRHHRCATPHDNCHAWPAASRKRCSPGRQGRPLLEARCAPPFGCVPDAANAAPPAPGAVAEGAATAGALPAAPPPPVSFSRVSSSKDPNMAAGLAAGTAGASAPLPAEPRAAAAVDDEVVAVVAAAALPLLLGCGGGGGCQGPLVWLRPWWCGRVLDPGAGGGSDASPPAVPGRPAPAGAALCGRCCCCCGGCCGAGGGGGGALAELGRSAGDRGGGGGGGGCAAGAAGPWPRPCASVCGGGGGPYAPSP